MFCHKCGYQSIESSVFCQKCGVKLIADEMSTPTLSRPVITSEPATSPKAPVVPAATVESQSTVASAVEPKKKKSKKLFIIGGIVAAIILVIIVAMNWGGSIDYIATVKGHQPFGSQGTNLSYGEVLTKYIESPEWKARESGDTVYVDISGKINGSDADLLVTIKVAVNTNNPNSASISPESVTLDGVKSPTQNDAVEFLLAMFFAYDDGWDDITELLASSSTQSATQTSFTRYVNEEHGISFDYPSDWMVSNPTTIVDIITVFDGNGASFDVSENYYLPFELDSGDEALIEASVNEIHEFVSVSDANINGHLMRELIYKSDTGIHGPTFVVNYFYFVEDIPYQIINTVPADELGRYQAVFDAIMDSYTITSQTSGVESTSLTKEDAYDMATDWLTLHQLFNLILLEDYDVTFENKEYFHFDLRSSGAGVTSHVTSICVNKATGEMLSYDWAMDTFEPLEDWYATVFGNNAGMNVDAGIDSLCEDLEIYYKSYLTAINQQDIGYISNATTEQIDRLSERLYGVNKDDIFTFDQIIVDLDSINLYENQGIQYVDFYAAFQFTTEARADGKKESGANIQLVKMVSNGYSWTVTSTEVLKDSTIGSNQRVLK